MVERTARDTYYLDDVVRARVVVAVLYEKLLRHVEYLVLTFFGCLGYAHVCLLIYASFLARPTGCRSIKVYRPAPGL